MSLSKVEKKAFETAFADMLASRVHSDYRRAPEVKGHFVEFRRQTDEGLFLSYNFLRTTHDYSLCFAILLSPHQCETLWSPLVLGSRFDGNRTLWRQYFDDLGLQRGDPEYPAYLWSGGVPRINTLELISRAIHAPERQLYPLYRQCLVRGRSRIVDLLLKGAEILEAAARFGLPPDAPAPALAETLGLESEALHRWAPLLGRISAVELARGGSAWAGFGPPTNTVNLDMIRPEVLVLANLQAFRSTQIPLRSIADRVSSLEA